MVDVVLLSKFVINEVLIDKGIYVVSSSVGKLIVGLKYGVYIKNDIIIKVVKKFNNVELVEIIVVVSDINVKFKKGSIENIMFFF